MVSSRRQKSAQNGAASAEAAAPVPADVSAPSTLSDADEKSASGKQPTSPSILSRFNDRLDNFLFSEVTIAPLVYFRLVFGCIMLYEVSHFFNSTLIERYYMRPIMYFKYFGWHWMPGPLPGHQMNLFYFGMGIIYVFYILGLFFRVTSILAFLGFFYWFNLDVSQHLNHFYLVSLVSFYNMFLPLNRNASLDVIRKPELRVAKVPAWTVRILVLLISVPYFFGGIAKINSDWLQGEPMRGWLLDKFPRGHVLACSSWAPYFFAWGGMLYDLSISPMLLWRPTRVFAVISTAYFHLNNHNMFSIGIFPWFMLFSTPLYFEPDKLIWILKFEWVFSKPVETNKTLKTPPERRSRVKWFFGAFMAYHCLMPFRHHLYPGNTAWTEEGHLYSWHMMLRHKESDAYFTVKLANGTDIEVDNTKFLTKRQNMRMSKRPFMVLQFAHYLCKVYEKRSKGPVEVYVDNEVSLNGRRYQDCIDPERDLCKAKLTWAPSDWIVPLEIPLWDRSMDSLLERIRKRPGTQFVGTRAFKMTGGGLHWPSKEDHGKLRIGNITKYVPKDKIWKVTFDGDKEYDFTKDDLAISQRLQAQYENNAIDLEENAKSEL